LVGPLVTNGMVVMQTPENTHQLVAYRVGCGSDGATCRPAWVADVGAPIFPSPVVGDGMVYVSVVGVGVQAFAAGCAAEGVGCEPTWVARVPGGPQGQPVVSDGVVYVLGSDRRIYAVDGATGSSRWVGDTASPLLDVEKSLEHPPVVGDGVIVIAFARNYATSEVPSYLYAFPTSCASDGGACRPEWWARIPDEFLSEFGPAIADGFVYVGTETAPGSGIGHVFAYPVSCAKRAVGATRRGSGRHTASSRTSALLSAAAASTSRPSRRAR
jgi:hypothetical protein